MEATTHITIIIGSLFGLFGFAGAPTAGETAVTQVVIDGAQRLQRIDGFGSGAFGGFTLFERGYCDAEFPRGVTYKTTPEQRRAMMTTAVQELGVTHLRVWICPAGIEPKNDNDDPAVMNWDAFAWEGRTHEPLLDQPNLNRQYGLKEWGDLLTVVVPLGVTNWIVTPGRVEPWLHKKLKDPNDPTRFDEYAEWAAAHLLYLKKTFGLEAPFWSMFNEPDVQGFKDPQKWIRWVTATGRRFRKEGLQTRIMLPDFMDVYAAVPLTRAILADDEARSYVGALAYHHYRSSFDDPQPFLSITTRPETADSGKLHNRLTGGARAMAELGRQYNLPAWETETAYYPQPLKDKNLSPWDVARGRANEIHYELSAGASAVAGMLMIWVDAIDPRVNYTVRMSGHHIVMTTDGTKTTQWAVTKDCGAIFGHYGRYVRPGDSCIRADSDNGMVRVTAFVTGGGDRYVAVLINNASEPVLLAARLDGISWTPRFAGGLHTDERQAMAPLALSPAGEGAKAWRCTLPALSVSTLVWSRETMGRLELPKDILFR